MVTMPMGTKTGCETWIGGGAALNELLALGVLSDGLEGLRSGRAGVGAPVIEAAKKFDDEDDDDDVEEEEEGFGDDFEDEDEFAEDEDEFFEDDEEEEDFDDDLDEDDDEL